MYPLDDQTIETSLTVAGITVRHKFNRPTKQQLIERDSRVRCEETTLDDGQIETIYDDDLANIRLWDETATEVAGYDMGDHNLDWVPVTEQVRSLMPSEHKIRAVEAMYLCSAVVEKASTNGGGFPLMGATEVSVQLNIGDMDDPSYTLNHVLRRPTESEWTAYRRGIQRILQVRGTKHPRYMMQANLGTAVAFYDALLIRIEGATIDGQPFSAETREAFVRAVDPMHKRVITRAFADHWGADLRNLKQP